MGRMTGDSVHGKGLSFPACVSPTARVSLMGWDIWVQHCRN